MQIQGAKPDDLEAIQRLLSTFELPYRDLTPSHLKHFLICRDDGNINGTIGVELYGKAGLLRSLVVSPEHRKRGIGARLTDELEQCARREGAETLYLLTTSASDYFGRRGYNVINRDELPKAIQRTEEVARLCPSDATCMRKTVAASAEKEAA